MSDMLMGLMGGAALFGFMALLLGWSYAAGTALLFIFLCWIIEKLEL